MFAPKDLRPSEIMALRTLIGGRTGNMPQTLEGIIESACLERGRFVRMSCFHGMLLVPVSALAASGWSGAGSAPNNAIILMGLRCEAHTRRGCGRGLLRLWELRASVSLLILIGRRPSRVVGGIHPRHRARPRPRRRNLQIEGAASRFIGGLPERQKACVSKYWVD